MTEPTHRPTDHEPAPNVDEVIHDAKTLSGLLHEPTDEPNPYAAADQHSTASNPIQSVGGRVPVTVASGAPVADPHAAVAHVADAHPSAAAGRGAPDTHAAPASHAGGHGAAHEEDDLGPVDTAAWGAGLLGTAVALFVAFCFVLATSGSNPF